MGNEHNLCIFVGSSVSDRCILLGARLRDVCLGFLVRLTEGVPSTLSQELGKWVICGNVSAELLQSPTLHSNTWAFDWWRNDVIVTQSKIHSAMLANLHAHKFFLNRIISWWRVSFPRKCSSNSNSRSLIILLKGNGLRLGSNLIIISCVQLFTLNGQ